MTFTQIEYFVEAARCKNLTKAAEKLYVSQQAISKQIQSLEQELGVPLLIRNNKGIALTSAGEICLDNWAKILRLQQETIDKVQQTIHKEKTQLRVGIIEYASVREYMIPILEAFMGEDDSIECSYEVDNVVNLCQQMNQGRLDLLITMEGEVEKENYDSISLQPWDLQVGLAVGNSHPLASKKQLGLKDVQKERLLLLKDSYSNKAAERILGYLKREKFKPIAMEYFDNINTLELALSTGKGVTIAYNVILQEIDRRIKFYPLDIPKDDYWVSPVVAWNRQENVIYARKLAEVQKQLREKQEQP